MGSWSALLIAYLLGGVTFIPLLTAAVLLHAHLTFPRRDDGEAGSLDPRDDIVQAGDDLGPLKDAQKVLKDEQKARGNHHEPDTAAGYFAVCREYAPMGINAKPIERSTPVGSTTVAAPSPSVYQTMYRSIFDRKQIPGPLDDLNSKNISQRPKKAGNVFFVVLRHGHLMLFDDDEQLEVRHVISLAHHDISIYSGGDKTPEGELFIKRNALCLSRRTDGLDIAADSQLSKPFYLFSENCSAKEDFYFALLRNQEQTLADERRAPAPMPFDVKNMISLVQRLHSSEEHLHTRWLNAMLGRIFLGIYKTPDVENSIREKLTKKISRVKRPSFLSGITIKKIDTGESAPYFTNIRLRDLAVEGECSIEADMRYTGNCRIEVAATARLELGARIKARDINLVLAVVLRKVEGHVLFKIKPPPSNRVWFSFQQMPKMEMTIEPIVSARQITYTVILRQIENRIKEVIAETLVLPFWDDVPFFRTEHKKWRGGIWEDDNTGESSKEYEDLLAQAGNVDEVERVEEQGDPPPIEKSYSVPVTENSTPTGLFGRKVTSQGTGNPKMTASSTSVDKNPAASAPSLLRSGSFPSTSSPIVGTDATNADLFKPSSSPPDHSPAADAIATLSAKSQPESPADTPPLGSPLRPPSSSKTSSLSSTSSKDGTDSDKDCEVTPKAGTRRYTTSSSESKTHDDGENSPPVLGKGAAKSQTGSLSRGFFLRRDNPMNSVPASSTGDGGRPDSPKRMSLASVTNAAGAARRWGWNALQRNQDGDRNGHQSESSAPSLDLSKPMGGGQPLPPPGQPLPMPERSKITAIPVPRRKPIPPPPPLPERPKNDEWSEHKIQRRPVPPPPLPRRRQPGQDGSRADEDSMLVVAAPDDAELITPPDDIHHPEYLQPFVEDAAETEEPVATSTAPDEFDDDTTKDDQHEDEEPAEEHVALRTPGSDQHGYGEEGADDDDDGEFEAWMGNVDEPDLLEEHDVHDGGVVSSEGIA